MIEVRLLGAFSIRSGAMSIALTSRRAQALLAFPILNRGTSYRREQLAGQLWPESPEDHARDYLRHALWRIRTSIQTVSSASCLQAAEPHP